MRPPRRAAELSASGAATLKLWCAGTGTLRHTLSGHGHAVYSGCFSPDGAVANLAVATPLARLLLALPFGRLLLALPFRRRLLLLRQLGHLRRAAHVRVRLPRA
mgnify:CR=1 FL=1